MSRKAPRIFRTADGFTAGDFLHYGFDNIAAAELLFKANARYFDSAGYLAHLGLELILKAWHLHAFSQFEEGHLLSSLWKKLQQNDSSLDLDKESSEALGKIDEYFRLRYPNPGKPQEMGSDDLPHILNLSEAICSQMPQEMYKIINALTGVRKGGRVLMEKPIGG